MSSFCRQCFTELWPEVDPDKNDMINLCTEDEIAYELCEHCGNCIVDHTGKCLHDEMNIHESEYTVEGTKTGRVSYSA